MESKHTLRLTYSSSVSKFCEINSSFDSAVMRIAYTGRNRNGSFISKEAFERSMATMFNCPVVCNYNREDDTIGSHDIEVVSDSSGTIKLVNTTVPVGVVPESAQPYWEYVTEDDGSIKEYLCTDVLLWKRQEAYDKIVRSGICSESMEISVKSGRRDKTSDVYVIDDFEFTAFCLLGEDVEPCFESACVELFTKGELKRQIEEMMADMKKEFSLINTHPVGDADTAQYEVDIYSQDIETNTEGGEKLEKETSLVEEQFTTSDEVGVDEPNTEESGDENFELASNLRDSIVSAAEAETIDTCFGEIPRYWMIDFDTEAAEVYCHDSVDWKIYGFSYSTNGDNVVIDFDSKKRVKYVIVDFDEGDIDYTIAPAFGLMSQRYEENDRQWREKYDAVFAENETLRADADELSALRKFKADTEESEFKARRDAVFADFDDLNGIEAYEALREDFNIGIDELEEKCFALRGRNGTPKPSAEAKPKIKVAHENVGKDAEPYGGLFVKYGFSD